MYLILNPQSENGRCLSSTKMKLLSFLKPKSKPAAPKTTNGETKTVPQAPTQAQTVSQNKLGTVLTTKPQIQDPVTAVLEQNMDLTDVIAPQMVEIDFDYIKINDVYLRTLFISGYPRFVSPGWLEQVINFNSSLDISFFIYPIEAKGVLDDLLRKVAEMEATEPIVLDERIPKEPEAALPVFGSTTNKKFLRAVFPILVLPVLESVLNMEVPEPF